MNRLTQTSISTGLLAFAAVLAGCGGGGTTSSGDAASPSPTTVSGTAAKGIVKQARVLVCRIVNGAPETDASCASTVSMNDGSYSVTLNDGFTGPAMIKVMAGTASMMQDETTGTDIPYNMTMRAVVPAVSKSTIANVTPFSEMAASAVSMTTIDATKIGQSNAAVQSLMASFNIDMGVLPMLDLKNNGANASLLSKQANMVKQLARVAMAAKNSSMLTDSNAVPCNAAGTTTSQQFACTVAAMARVMNSYATSDPAKAANMMSALNAQTVANVTMPILKTDGTLAMEIVDMRSCTSIQSAMQKSGMSMSTAANTTTMMACGTP